MADVGQMPLPWLLSGHQYGFGDHDYIDTISQITRLLERVCQETGRQYTPEQKSQIVALMVLVAQHERQQGLLPQLFKKSMVLEACYFLDALLPDDLLDVYTGALKAWTTGTLTTDNERQLSYMITRANSYLFDGKVGDLFFERVGFDMTPQRQTHMQQIIGRLQQLVGIYTPLKLLDLGCGNGRHIFHIARHYPPKVEKIWGIDASQNAIRRAQNYALKTNSQKTTLLCGPIDDVNLADGSVNAILCMQALPYVPCFMNGESGAAAVFKEMYRLLQKGGVVHISCREGENAELLPFEQPYTADMLMGLANKVGFKVKFVGHYRVEQSANMKAAGPCTPDKYKTSVEITLQK